jgi:fucose permease
MNVYGVITGLCAIVFLLLATGRLDESAAHAEGHNNSFTDSLMEMSRLFVRPLVYVFLASAFLYVLIEQSFGTWLPTFNNEILKLPNALSIQFASMLPGMTALGRIAAGVVLKRVPWFGLLAGCVIGMGAIVVFVLPLARDVVADPDAGLLHAPAAAYLIPLMGLLMAPIYPVINSVVLSSLPKPMHAAMTGLIVVFSALGGTLGSYITARVFAAFDGIQAFYFSLVPMTLLLITLSLFKRRSDRESASVAAAKASA